MAADKHALEFWSDSFHEGDWSCKELGNHLPIIRISHLNGFIPQYLYSLPNGEELEVTVYGSYGIWSPLPVPIGELLEWGKPDLVVYSPSEEKILFAVEETAAVPTGNQALQRFERIFGSAKRRIPFWYLVGEYGMHLDKGVRRDSIWAAVACLKLTVIFGVPSIVLHYSTKDSPEDYNAGTGLHSLFNILSKFLLNWAGVIADETMIPELQDQYLEMFDFIQSQWQQITDYLPSVEKLIGDGLAREFAVRALGNEPSNEFSGFLRWGLTRELPDEIRQKQSGRSLIKMDRLMARLEELVESGKAYTLSKRTGSRPQPRDSVGRWIRAQEGLFDVSGLDNPPEFTLKITEFPPSPSGLLHLTTAKNILYLCDLWEDLAREIISAYPRLAGVLKFFNAQDPVMFYVSNSMKPGRIFGDPYTGQLTNYSINFARNMSGEVSRKVVTYYPHQVHSQLFDSSGKLRSNKGITLMKVLVDLAIFHSGVAVVLKDGPIVL